MRIAFIVTSFPHPSSTPVLKQITALIERGVMIPFGSGPAEREHATEVLGRIVRKGRL